MKFWAAIFFSVIVVALAHESAVLDETTDLLQERAMLDTGAKTQAKVSISDAAKTSAKVGATSKAKTKATVTIGTHQLDAESVSMARARLGKITMKLGARHPVFLGEAAGISDFVAHDARYVKGGYQKLTKILKKIDEFENELFGEKQEAVDKRENLYATCDKEGKNFMKSSEEGNKRIAKNKEAQRNRQRKIGTKKVSIQQDLADEADKYESLKLATTEVTTTYKNYWAATEERHQVRNVLMQALWLVCTGFATFRHTEYCTNIRQQPDFDEPSKAPFTVQQSEGNGIPAFYQMKAHSKIFGQTMQPVWEQQKIADASEVNQFDGDTDMEKGFVNNRAPWGVDPEGMEARGEDSDAGGADNELGESNKASSMDMSSAEMSSRLSFLLESSTVPQRISVPVTALIQAFDSDDAAVQGGLVEALVKMDTEEGAAQSNLDYTWYTLMIEKKQTMYLTSKEGQKLKKHGLAEFEGIEKDIATMDTNRDQEMATVADEKEVLKKYQMDQLMCERNVIEVEALIEAVNEELVNIKRLNSLLRYLVVGDLAKCDKINCKVESQGSCTWKTRGETQGSGPNAEDKACETETGADIPCDYGGSYPVDAYNPASKVPKQNNDDVFCACEYGFFSSQGDGENCLSKSCPGYGRIRYPGNGQGQGKGLPLTYQGQGLRTKHWLEAGGPTKYEPSAVCSGERLKEHGTCDPVEGKCIQCWIDKNKPRACNGAWADNEDNCSLNVTPEKTETIGNVFVVPDQVEHTMPDHGSKAKCEMWFVPWKFEDGRTKWTLGTDTNACSGQGEAIENFMGQTTGTCKCNTHADEAFYGDVCEKKKCKTQELFYTAESPIVCSGAGTCDTEKGLCKCDQYSTGDFCEEKRCPGFDKADPQSGTKQGSECGAGAGTCALTTGRCVCATGMSCGLEGQKQCPGACIYKDCDSNCGGTDTDGSSTRGLCDRFSGVCMCDYEDVFNGPSCVKPQRGSGKVVDAKQEMIWTSTMDKWGWSTCNNGYLMVGMKTDGLQTKDALYNLDQGVCQQPFEKGAIIDRAVEGYRCYHENWWKKFDTRGGKFCRRNYFVAGLFRSHCNSLYCIEMAKCCSVKRSLWTDCQWTDVKGWTDKDQGMEVSTDAGFIVGFFRDAQHTLAGITSLRECTPIWFGQLQKGKSRWD